jgi:two-component system, NarL family, sensor kinase
MVGSLVAFLVVVVTGFFALRSVAIRQATDETKTQALVEGQLAERAGLTDGLLKGKRSAIARMDSVVLGSMIDESVTRVKIWSKDGRILYSDQPALIGNHYQLGADDLELFRTGGADAEVSDLSRPENRFERQEGKLLEAYTPIRTPNGTQVLFEIYQRFSSINASSAALLGKLAPPLIGGLLVLLLFQVPLAWSLARSLQRGHRDREALLNNAIEASTEERRRIASDLHDGVVQDLAGVAFGLAPLAESAARRGADDDAEVLEGATGTLRQGVRDLRTLLVEIHPPSLESAGLEAALNDLLSPFKARGIATELQVDDRATAGSGRDALIYRVAREALRNAQAYSEADRVRIELTRPAPQTTRLRVTDDGRGFSAAERARRGEEGHVGLTLLEGLVRQSDGTLAVDSEPGAGTTVTLEVPVGAK